MGIDLDSMVQGVVSKEDLAEGKVQVTTDGDSARAMSPDDGPLDSGVIEEQLRAMRENLQSDEAEEPAEEQEESGGEEEEHEEEEEAPKKESKRSAQARIRELNARAKQAEQAQREYQQRFEQMQAQYQQQQYQMQQQIAQQQQAFQQKMIELEQRRLEMAQEEKSRAELAAMSEPERRAYEWQRKIESDAVKRAKAEVTAELNELKSQVNEFKQWKDGAKEHAQAAQRQKQMTQMVNQAIDQYVYANDMSTEEAKALRPVIEEGLTVWAAAYGESPETLAPNFRKFLDAWAAAKNKATAKSGSNTLKKGKSLPKPATKVGSAQTKEPSLEEIRKLGYDNFVRYRAAKAIGKVR